MRFDQDYYADHALQYRKKALLKNSVLFIDDYENPLKGDALALLVHFLNSPDYAEWTVVWTLPEDFSMEKECAFPKGITSEKVELVLEGSDEFLSDLSTFEWIVVSKCLPTYFVKRNGQKMFGCFEGTKYFFENNINEFRVRYTATLSKLDYLYTESEKPELFSYTVIHGTPLRYTLPQPFQKADILVSVSKKIIGEAFEEYESKYKAVSAVIVNRGWNTKFFVTERFWNTFKNENAPEVLESMELNSYPVQRFISSAKIFITDSYSLMEDAVRQGIFVIYLVSGSKYFEPDEIYSEEIIRYAADWEEAVLLLPDVAEYVAEKNIPTEQQKSKDVWEQIDDLFIRGCFEDQKKTGSNNATLFVMPGKQAGKLWKLFRYMKPQSNVQILLRSSSQKACWETTEILDTAIPLFCKSGRCQTAEEGVYTKEELTTDWQRMIGRQQFTKIMVWDDGDVLWNHLYEVAPTDYLVRKAGVDFFDEIAGDIQNPVIDKLTDQTVPLQEVRIEGESYYNLGKTKDNDRLFLKVKARHDKWLLYYVENEDVSYNEGQITRLIQEEKNRNLAVLDPKKFLSESDLRKLENIYYLPVSYLPMPLVAAIEGAWVEKNAMLRKVLGYLNIPFLCREAETLDKQITNVGTALAIETADEVIELF